GQKLRSRRPDSPTFEPTRHHAGRSSRRHRLAFGFLRMSISNDLVSDSRILGIDPGLQATGYGVIENGSRGLLVREAGVVRSNDSGAGADLAQRVRSLYDGILEVIDQFHPQ